MNLIKGQETPYRFWKKYELGKDYLDKKNLVGRTQKCWDFYAGDQWKHVESDGEYLPMLNFIEKIIDFKVSTISQSSMVAHFSDLEAREELAPVYELFDRKFASDWEKADMDTNLWSFTDDAAVTGDGILYFPTGDIRDVQLLGNTSVLYGDESQKKVQKQPYVIIHGRETVISLREEARRNGIPEDQVMQITADTDTMYVVGNKSEVSEDRNIDTAKATFIIYMEKRNGVVFSCKCTQKAFIAPFEPICSRDFAGNAVNSMSLYPIVKMNWKDFPNSARGRGEVEHLIPNQVEYNLTLVRLSLTIRMTSYARFVYDPNMVINPEALTKVGVPIEVMSGGVNSIDDIIRYVQPAQSNGEARSYAETLLDNTQELSGAGETATGNINPSRVAATALIAIRDQAALPLNQQQAKLKTAVEDLAKVWMEIEMVYHPEGFEVVTEEEVPVLDENGEPVVDMYGQAQTEKKNVLRRVTKAEMDMMKPEIRIDVSPDNPGTVVARQNFADNLFNTGKINLRQYARISPKGSIVPTEEIYKICDEQDAEQARLQAQMQAQIPPPIDEDIDEED